MKPPKRHTGPDSFVGSQVHSQPREGRVLGKVMVVDDAVSELRLIESILKSAGHQVVTYDNGEIGRASCRERVCHNV